MRFPKDSQQKLNFQNLRDSSPPKQLGGSPTNRRNKNKPILTVLTSQKTLQHQKDSQKSVSSQSRNIKFNYKNMIPGTNQNIMGSNNNHLNGNQYGDTLYPNSKNYNQQNNGLKKNLSSRQLVQNTKTEIITGKNVSKLNLNDIVSQVNHNGVNFEGMPRMIFDDERPGHQINWIKGIDQRRKEAEKLQFRMKLLESHNHLNSIPKLNSLLGSRLLSIPQSPLILDKKTRSRIIVNHSPRLREMLQDDSSQDDLDLNQYSRKVGTQSMIDLGNQSDDITNDSSNYQYDFLSLNYKNKIRRRSCICQACKVPYLQNHKGYQLKDYDVVKMNSPKVNPNDNGQQPCNNHMSPKKSLSKFNPQIQQSKPNQFLIKIVQDEESSDNFTNSQRRKNSKNQIEQYQESYGSPPRYQVDSPANQQSIADIFQKQDTKNMNFLNVNNMNTSSFIKRQMSYNPHTQNSNNPENQNNFMFEGSSVTSDSDNSKNDGFPSMRSSRGKLNKNSKNILLNHKQKYRSSLQDQLKYTSTVIKIPDKLFKQDKYLKTPRVLSTNINSDLDVLDQATRNLNTQRRTFRCHRMQIINQR
eukprot:403372093